MGGNCCAYRTEPVSVSNSSATAPTTVPTALTKPTAAAPTTTTTSRTRTKATCNDRSAPPKEFFKYSHQNPSFEFYIHTAVANLSEKITACTNEVNYVSIPYVKEKEKRHDCCNLLLQRKKTKQKKRLVPGQQFIVERVQHRTLPLLYNFYCINVS